MFTGKCGQYEPPKPIQGNVTTGYYGADKESIGDLEDELDRLED